MSNSLAFLDAARKMKRAAQLLKATLRPCHNVSFCCKENAVHTRKIMNPLIPVQDFIGRRFGRLVVLSFLGSRRHPYAKYAKVQARFWECLCDCGEIIERQTSHLMSGNVKSCGCLQRDNRKQARPKHGMTGTSEHDAWAAMLGRCHNTEHQAYHLYGARGILVCERWQNSFENFIADMGRKPSAKHTLDRIDNNLGYRPDNCRWATMKEQGQNRRGNQFITFNGQTLCISEWERRLGFSSGLIRWRQKLGLPIEQILTTPPKPHISRMITYAGQTHCRDKWERILGFKRGLLKYRFQCGWSVEKSLTTPPTNPKDQTTGRFLPK